MMSDLVEGSRHPITHLRHIASRKKGLLLIAFEKYPTPVQAFQKHPSNFENGPSLLHSK